MMLGISGSTEAIEEQKCVEHFFDQTPERQKVQPGQLAHGTIHPIVAEQQPGHDDRDRSRDAENAGQRIGPGCQGHRDDQLDVVVIHPPVSRQLREENLLPIWTATKSRAASDSINVNTTTPTPSMNRLFPCAWICRPA